MEVGCHCFGFNERPKDGKAGTFLHVLTGIDGSPMKPGPSRGMFDAPPVGPGAHRGEITPRMKPCPVCKGRGRVPDVPGDMTECPECFGRGKIAEAKQP